MDDNDDGYDFDAEIDLRSYASVNNNYLNESDSDEEESDDSDIPQSPADSTTTERESPLVDVLSAMVNMLYINDITVSCIEKVFRFLNVALIVMNEEYRFPRKLTTFLKRQNFEQRFYKGLVYYDVCAECHTVFAPGTSAFNCACSIPSTVDRPLSMTKFPYNSLISTLRKFFMRPGFVESISSWRYDHFASQNQYQDIYDGSVFKNFRLNPSDPQPFTQESVFNLMLTLNVDWYNPYDKSTYSAGGIYMTIQNLPKANGRDLVSNMILVGVMPGPHEPQTCQINNYLDLLVDKELSPLINGVNMEVLMPDNTVQVQLVKAALTMVCADFPAAKKTSGFVNFNAICGCHHCLKRFHQNGKASDYSGYDIENWVKNTKEMNYAKALEWKQLVDAGATQREITHVEQTNGTRWSSLHKLPYFDAPNFTVVEPMHNLYLGTVKTVVTMWVETGMLSNNDIKKAKKFFGSENYIVQNKESVSSVLRKMTVGKGFKYFKAAEWRVWALTMAEVHLRSSLPIKVFDHFMLLMKALKALDKSSVSGSEVELAHGFLLQFCQEFEGVYGKTGTPNMHAHLHLKKCVEMYGPLPCFWGFHFERYNGVMKNLGNNHRKGIEMTFVRKMLHTIHSEDYYNEIFTQLLN